MNRKMERAACAACRHQRRGCSANCPLAPYFPAYRHKDFQNVCKHYGLQRVVKLLNKIPPHQRDDFIASVLYESNLRALDPAGGCCSAIAALLQQIDYCSSQLDYVQALLSFHKSRSRNLHENRPSGDEPSTSARVTDMTQQLFETREDLGDEFRTREILKRLLGDDE